ncbi:MAG: hypothetical protein QXJ19_04075 [Candidatus Bathyarchaeia archaeon]|nr:hypothetical protein [Candidatus Bathyarchaeota archaeon]
MEVVFSRHVLDKIANDLLRIGVTKDLIESIVRSPDEILYDTVTNRYIAVRFDQKIAVIYERRDQQVFIVTAYSSGIENIIRRRKRSGRWI